MGNNGKIGFDLRDAPQLSGKHCLRCLMTDVGLGSPTLHGRSICEPNTHDMSRSIVIYSTTG